jgi:hypothetical protein
VVSDSKRILEYLDWAYGEGKTAGSESARGASTMGSDD